jgi:hypothetical protein
MSQTNINISNQIEAIKYFIEKMDIEMIDAFLDNDKTYQEFEKGLFINKLDQVFLSFLNFGDTFLIAVDGNCNKCDKTKKGYTFIGNKSNNYLSIIFDTADSKIKDLYECSNFKNKLTNLNLKKRIFIDNEFPSPF